MLVREVLDGARTDAVDRQFVELLEALVADKAAFCPISDAVFVELMKQGDPARRAKTAAIIDRFSAGVALLPSDDRRALEVETMVLSAMPPNGPGKTRTPWTHIAYVLGHIHPSDTPFPPEVELAIQKAFFDELGARPIAQLAELTAAHVVQAAAMDALARDLNEKNAAHRSQMVSFDAVLQDEFHGVSCGATQAAQRVYATLTGTPAAAPSPEGAAIWARLLAECLKREDLAKRLPTFHVVASLHALIRWDHRDKAIVANDLFDFDHAAAAVGHCDAMFTENGLTKMLTHRRLRLDQLHGCFVTADTQQAVDYLRSVRSPPP